MADQENEVQPVEEGKTAGDNENSNQGESQNQEEVQATEEHQKTEENAEGNVAVEVTPPAEETKETPPAGETEETKEVGPTEENPEETKQEDSAEVEANAGEATDQNAPEDEDQNADGAKEEAPAEDKPVEQAGEGPSAETEENAVPAEDVTDTGSAEPAQEEAQAEEAPIEETQKDEAPTEEAPTEEAQKDEAPTEEAQKDEALEQEAQKDEVPTEEAQEDEAPAQEAQKDEIPAEEAPVEEAEKDEPAAEAEENAAPAEGATDTEQAQEEAPAPEADNAHEQKAAEDDETQKEEAVAEAEPTPVKEDAEELEQEKEAVPETDGEKDEKPVEETAAETEPEAVAEAEPETAELQAVQAEEVKADEPVQVGADVSEIPPGSPKVALEERRPNFNLDATATVKFVLMPSGQVVTLACTLGQTLDSLKTHFAYELKMPSTVIMLMFDGKSLSDSTMLADLGVGPNGTIQLEMQSADPVNTPIKPYRPRQEYHMPDVITVRVMTEDCEAKDVVVEIERSRSKKPFLGGFRNKNSGVEFHNASAQTAKKPRPPPTIERFCRDTQTCEQKSMRQQTTNTTSTQMTGIGVFMSNIEDKLLVPGKYFSADDHWALILRNVIILQKYYRRWLAKRYVTKLKEDKARRLEWERQEELRKKKEKEERIKRDYARRLNPKTKADFDMLLHCLEKWRQEEMERINTTLTGAERKAALCMLLDQETELLSAIERHKNEAFDDNKSKRIMAFLDKAAAPKKWQGHDGKLTYMDTPFTIRAKELRDIFNSINMKYLTQDERLDVLLTLKHTVKEHDCKLTQEIIELIDREADLLMRGVKEGNLTGLRKRISTLFLQYTKTPTFNPEAAKLLKVPQDPSTLRKNINYCHSCGNYLPSTDFFITSNSKHVGRCRNCVKIENDGRQREDHTFYRVMLKALRKSEEAMQDGSSICFLLQEHDLRYLVENIWSNQSVLSAWDDLYDLVLVRWDKHQEWSPWNCILLTHDEAEAHKKLFSLEEGYGQVFIHKVTQKHNFARNYFSRLPGMAELLRQKLGNRDLTTTNGPSVSGQPIPKAQKV